METPLVSVIIPCYNCEKFLRPALNSIINQTYRNLEIIIINDGSTDKTVEIIKEFQKFDQRIVFIDNIQNKGLIFTLNKGIVCSQGKYIARMDSDDISLENRIEQQVNYMENNPDISVCGTNSYIIDEDGNIKGKSKLPISVSENFQFMAYSSTIYHPTVLMRSDIIKKEFYNNDFIHAEDYELWCRLLYKKNEKIVNLPEYLFKYRKVSTSVSSTNTDTQWKTSAKIFDNYNIVSEKYKELHKQIFFLREKQEIDEATKNYIYYVMKAIKKFKFSYQYTVLEKIAFYVIKQRDIKYFAYLCLKRGFIRTCIINRIRKML